MPITPTYPGIYIEELPATAHTITAAATSITAFVGYTHPFKTKATNWGKAVRIFNFTEYEREFGGLYGSGIIQSHVAYAVNQFFLNGGSDAYVVALQPRYYDESQTPPSNKGTVRAATLPVGGPTGFTFTAQEPTDLIPMTVTIYPQAVPFNDTADIIITYGSRAETFRKVTLKPAGPNFIHATINNLSSLVNVAPTTPPNYPAAFVAVNQTNLGYPPNYPDVTWASYNAADFGPVFQQDSSLDKVDIFNLLVIPGVADQSVWSEALAFCERKQAFGILDPPKQDSADGSGVPALPLIGDDIELVVPKSTNGALYFPHLRTTDPITTLEAELPPSGYVAGIYARTDVNRGVWKAPAGLETSFV